MKSKACAEDTLDGKVVNMDWTMIESIGTQILHIKDDGLRFWPGFRRKELATVLRCYPLRC